ncbi:MAG: MBL fold metallo-hydrolase [Muribaculaceae bacterium]|nr:MBL fold metallo-hydrolase [Muribaculaceae bacterium]
MKITCIGHSGFAIESDDKSVTLIFDYYTDNAHVLEPILQRAQNIYVFVSHSHRDHLSYDIFDWQHHYPIARYIIANECRRKLKRSINLDNMPVTFLHHDEDWQDERIHVHAFNSTDAGVCFMVDIDGKRIFHAGDFTCWDMAENDEAASRKAKGDFEVILSAIAQHTSAIDVVMMPVVPNIGGDFAYGARRLLNTVNCDLFIPMHTWGRDREATQFELYRNPNYGRCERMSAGSILLL